MTSIGTSELVDVSRVEWIERRPGVFWKILWEEGDRKAILMRYEPGATIPRHRHVGDEQIFVLEGSVADETTTCTAGNYARRPPGCVHSVSSPDGALVFAVTSGPTQPVDAAPSSAGPGRPAITEPGQGARTAGHPGQ